MNFLFNLVLSLIAFAFAGIPTWIFLGLRSALSPQGFWEQLATGVLGWAVFGGVQVALLFVFIFAMIALWSSRPIGR